MTTEPISEELIPDFSENIEGIETIEKEETAITPIAAGFSTVGGSLSVEQILAIRSKTPPRFVKTRVGRGGKQLSYVPLPIFIRKMNFTFGYGAWSFKVVKSEIVENQALVQGELIINIQPTPVIISQFGGHDIARDKEKKNAVDIGDTFKAAASDCFKKCASMLGLFADVYAPDDFIEIKIPISKEEKQEQDEEIEKTQIAINKLRDIAGELSMTIVELSKFVKESAGKSITTLTIKEANKIISILKKQKEASSLLNNK